MHLRRLMELPKNLSHTAWNHSNITPFSQTPDQLAARLEMWNCIKCLSWSSLTVSTKRWSRWWLSHPPLLCCTDLPPVLHLLWEPSVSWLSSLSLETPCMQKDSFYLRIHVSPLAPSRFNMLSWCLPWERSHLGHWLAISQPAAQEPRNVETGPTARRWPHFFFFFFHVGATQAEEQLCSSEWFPKQLEAILWFAWDCSCLLTGTLKKKWAGNWISFSHHLWNLPNLSKTSAFQMGGEISKKCKKPLF